MFVLIRRRIALKPTCMQGSISITRKVGQTIVSQHVSLGIGLRSPELENTGQRLVTNGQSMCPDPLLTRNRLYCRTIVRGWSATDRSVSPRMLTHSDQESRVWEEAGQRLVTNGE